MSALLVIFILAVVVLALSLTQQQAQLEAQEQLVQDQEQQFQEQLSTIRNAEVVRAAMLDEIRSNLEQQGIQVTVSEDNSVLRIPTSLLGFASGSYTIAPENHRVALAIGTAIADAVDKDDRFEYLDTVFIEGHTDDQQFDGLEGTGNWGLSTFRAIALWDLWEQALPASKRLSGLEGAEGSQLFSVSGYGETRPVAEVQTTDDQRAANRRIDVRFTVERFSADELAEIVGDGVGVAGASE